MQTGRARAVRAWSAARLLHPTWVSGDRNTSRFRARRSHSPANAGTSSACVVAWAFAVCFALQSLPWLCGPFLVKRDRRLGGLVAAVVHCIPPLCRFARRAGFVALRQTFVRWCQNCVAGAAPRQMLAQMGRGRPGGGPGPAAPRCASRQFNRCAATAGRAGCDRPSGET